jgi:hypothetical protein
MEVRQSCCETSHTKVGVEAVRGMIGYLVVTHFGRDSLFEHAPTERMASLHNRIGLPRKGLGSACASSFSRLARRSLRATACTVAL